MFLFHGGFLPHSKRSPVPKPRGGRYRSTASFRRWLVLRPFQKKTFAPQWQTLGSAHFPSPDLCRGLLKGFLQTTPPIGRGGQKRQPLQELRNTVRSPVMFYPVSTMNFAPRSGHRGRRRTDREIENEDDERDEKRKYVSQLRLLFDAAVPKRTGSR